MMLEDILYGARLHAVQESNELGTVGAASRAVAPNRECS
jgi:hypothetical protein